MQVSFEQRGRADAPMILFIHGGGMDSTVWESSMDFFQSYYCVTVDLPEHGKSASCKPFSIAESAGCIAEFIKTNASFGRAHLVGHSLGGVVLIELLRSSPELIDHAVVCSGNLRPSFLYTVGSNKLFCKFVSAVNRKRYQKDYVNPEMLQRVYREMRQYSILANKLPTAEIPILLLAGEKEPKFVKESNRDLAEILPNAKNAIISNANHDYPWKESMLLSSIVDHWIHDCLPNNERIIQVNQNK